MSSHKQATKNSFSYDFYGRSANTVLFNIKVDIFVCVYLVVNI
jgi:hypothetical protein